LSSAKLLVDGGGTATRAALWCAGQISPPVQLAGRSCNPRSVGRARALDNLNDLVRLVWQDRPRNIESMDSAWLCLSTASSPDALTDFATELLEPPSAPLRQAGEIWIMNDIAPLLMYDGRITERVVVICGTGTGFCGVNAAKGLSARASGQEYLLADEGGGFDLGLQGLRAAIRQDDGRGPRTRLTELLASWRGVCVGELFDFVYGSPEPKVLISSFAPFVLAAAEEGDACARSITRRAAGELVTGIRAVAVRTDLSDSFEVLFAGSNLVGSYAVLREQLLQLLLEAMPNVTVRPTSGSTLTAVANMAQVLPGDQRLQTLLRGCMPLVRLNPENRLHPVASDPAMAVERGNSRFEFAQILSPVLSEIEGALLSGRTILSAEVDRFEQAFADYIGCDYALGVNSGTDALVLAMEAVGIGPGDEVITVANTFHATVLAIARTGATPVLVDSRPDDFLMNVDDLAALVTERTKAIVAVHLYGLPLDLAPVAALCGRHGLHLIEDCAQAVGAMLGGRRVGSIGDVGCFSFHPSKNLAAAGDAGMITTSSKEIAARVRSRRYFGQRERKVHSELGHNSKLDALQAIVLYHKLPLLDEWNHLRRGRAERYRSLLAGLPVTFQRPGSQPAADQHVYHLFQVSSPERDALLRHLTGCGIDAVVRYPQPIHLQPAFEALGYRTGAFPVTERLAGTLLCLPIRPDLGDEEMNLVVAAMLDFFGR
jgi:dTDP-4-amino-4,6-dideoxygalactose transaminase/N-acetylglucosamine kinase-like BadF-type ATPase